MKQKKKNQWSHRIVIIISTFLYQLLRLFLKVFFIIMRISFFWLWPTNQLNLPTKYANNIAAIITATTSMHWSRCRLKLLIVVKRPWLSISSCTLKGTQTNPTTFNVQNRRKRRLTCIPQPSHPIMYVCCTALLLFIHYKFSCIVLFCDLEMHRQQLDWNKQSLSNK